MLLAVAYVASGGALVVLQGGMIFLPVTPVPPLATALPGGEEAWVRTSDGIDLPLWYLPPCPGPAGPDGAGRTAPAVILFHGTGGNRAALTGLATSLHDAGLAVVLAEYRGYGGAGGRPTEDGLALDAEATWSWLAARPGIDPDRVAYLGDSLGTRVATRLATTHPPAALVLRSPYTSIPAVAATRVRIFPTDLLVHEQFRTIDRIGSVRAPLLVVTGSADQVVPPDQSRAVLEAAGGPATWRERPGVIHEDPSWAGAGEHADHVAEWLQPLLGLTACPGAPST